MGNLLLILGVLFLALVIILPLVEKFGPKQTDKEVSKMSRYIFPLVGILMIIQTIIYFYFKG